MVVISTIAKLLALLCLNFVSFILVQIAHRGYKLGVESHVLATR